MKKSDAALLLGILDNRMFNAEAVRAAFRRAVKQAHPDTGDNQTPAHSVTELMAARDTLLSGIIYRRNSCKQCKGRGIVPGRIGAQRCAACGGSGERN